jgi:shikimate kinase
MKSSIALIGFMGAGKTAVGRVLAERLGKQFVELDLLIERRAGKSVAEIFEQDGEVAFRELEIEVTKRLVQSRAKGLVIACGGGIVLNRINIDRLKDESIIVYLTASPGVLLRRVSGGGGERPLLKAWNSAEPWHHDLATRSRLSRSIRELLRFREPFYERAADIRIDTSRLDLDGVAEQIIAELNKNESLNS